MAASIETQECGGGDVVNAENQANLRVKISGLWAYAFMYSPEAQRMLCEEMARIIRSLMRSLKNYDGYRTEYRVEILTKEETTL